MLDAARERSGAPGALTAVQIGEEDGFVASGRATAGGGAITDRTTFRVASITKTIVAALVLDAAERGELRLDDTVAELVPGVIRPEPPITVRMLLAHTSGIFDEGNDGDPVADVGRLPPGPLCDEARAVLEGHEAGDPVIASDRLLVALAETHDRYFAPGTDYHYANPNYQLAAMVLEAATGRSLAELFRRRVVEPLGLRRTSIAPADTRSPGLRGYGPGDGEGLVDLTDDLLWFGNGGNGGVISTAGELLTMVRSIVAGPLLTPSSRAAMQEPTEQSGRTYGLGIGTYFLSCGTFFGHGGGVNGTASLAVATPDGDRGAVVALNLRSDEDPELVELIDELVCPVGVDP